MCATCPDHFILLDLGIPIIFRDSFHSFMPIVLSIYQSFRPHWAVGLIQPLTEISIRRREIMFLGSKARLVRRADKLTAISEPTV
jgi:hypothetical protein